MGETVYRSHAARQVLRVLTLAVSAALLTTNTMGCGKKAVFVSAMYPKDPQLPPPVEYDLTVSSTLTPLVAVGYDNPTAAARCFEQAVAVAPLAVDMSVAPPFRGRVATLLRYANCVETKPSSVHECAVTNLKPLVDGCANDLDRARVLRAIADVAGALSATERAASGQTQQPLSSWENPVDCGRRPVRCRYENGVQRSLALGVALSLHDPSGVDAAEGDSPTSHPVVAMSGGAANGSFTAGYMHALLGYRKAALEGLPANERPAADRRFRFSTIAGTSVGSLVALLVDLYFAPERTEPATPIPSKHQEYFPSSECSGNSDPALQHERCALAALENIFGSRKVDEATLLCVERGGLLGFVGAKKAKTGRHDHLLRFDPLQKDILEPFLEHYGETIRNNDVIRITVAADLTQNAVIGLDERACRIDGVPTHDCLAAAVLTSITEPVFVPPVRRVFSGLQLGSGEGSASDAATRLTWFDGGLRSGTPSLFALLRAGGKEPKVLALTTTPLEGVAKAHPRNGLSTMFDSAFDTVDQVRKWEIGYAQVAAEERRRRLLDFCEVLGVTDCSESTPAAFEGALTSPPAGPDDPAPAAPADTPSLADRISGTSAMTGAIEAASHSPEVPAERPPVATPVASGRPVPKALPPLQPSDLVYPVFVPESIEPRSLFAAGYQFDPIMMQGLYLWGEWTFLSGYEQALGFLGWADLHAHDFARTELKRVNDELCATFGVGEGCTEPDPEVKLTTAEDLKAHFLAQRKEVKRALNRCSRQ